MRVRFYGVRGSCPAPGPDTAEHGGNTSCVSARLDDGTLLVFDAGTGIRTLGHELARDGHEGPIHLLLSHTHWDHIIGLPFFEPLFDARTHLVIHPLSNERQERFRWRPTIFDEIHFPVPASDIPCRVELADHAEGAWNLGSATIRRILLNHPGGAQGFRVEDRDGKVFCYLTDNEITPPGEVTTTLDELAAFARGADALVHDAQYLRDDLPRKHGWGHSVIADVLELGKRAAPRRLVLYHHDPDRTDDALHRIAEDGRAWLSANAPGTELVIAREGLALDL